MSRSWLQMIKDLTWRPHVRQIRKYPGADFVKELDKPISPQTVKNILSKNSDALFREFTLHGKEEVDCMLAGIDGMINKDQVDNFILKPLIVELSANPELQQLTVANALDTCVKYLLPNTEIKSIAKMGDALDSILSGDVVLFFGTTSKALAIGVRGWSNRGVQEPEAETVVRGPREGFTETLRINTSLIRRKIKSPALTIEPLKLGEVTRTDVVITYVNGLVNQQILAEVRRRLQRIKMDAVLETGYIEEMIEDLPYTPFPQIQHTERPDVMAAALLQGKIGILVDGTPFCLLIPAVFPQFFQSPDDYYEKAVIVFLTRTIRYVGFFIATLAPSIYIAVTTFHQEILPTSLALSIASGREGVPLPALLEAMLMVILLEVMQEASLRLPRPIGQTIGIVGALIIGDAAVKASIISPQMVIVIGVTAVSTYVIPYYSMGIAIRLIRIPMMLLAGFLGFYGVGLGFYALLMHLISMRSFGYPYLSPVAPMRVRAYFQDTLVRAPWWAMKRRPQFSDVANLQSGGKR